MEGIFCEKKKEGKKEAFWMGHLVSLALIVLAEIGLFQPVDRSALI